MDQKLFVELPVDGLFVEVFVDELFVGGKSLAVETIEGIEKQRVNADCHNFVLEHPPSPSQQMGLLFVYMAEQVPLQ